MSSWQKDRQSLAKLEERLAKLETPEEKKTQDVSNIEVEIPPELENADEETKAGYTVMYRQMQSRLEKQILGKVLDEVNKPAREERESASKVQKEVEVLGHKLGKDFTDNQKEILDYAGKNNFPLGTLDLAFKAWQKDAELKAYRHKAKTGEDINKQTNAKKKKDADIPKGDARRTGHVPKYDASKDGSKSLSEVMDEAFNEL